MCLAKILVVDDDRNLLEIIKMRLESASYEAVTAHNAEEALSAATEQLFDLVVIDLQLANQDGITLMEKLRLIYPDIPAIILTAYGSIESAVQAIKRGATSYLTKPFNSPELIAEIEQALKSCKRYTEIKKLQELLDEQPDFTSIVARSNLMHGVLEQVSRIARFDSTVYIYGESGTGKELIAKAIHHASTRRDKPFVAINCAAIPETLLESELFGYEKGSFTGAVRSTIGLFTQAHEGTIFLDEIANMPLSVQAKILRVLQERQFYPIGSKKPIAVDVRVLVATNRDLEEEVQRGSFREDLLYRIHVIPVIVPPLRERKEDIPLLVEHFLKRFCAQMGKNVAGLTPPAMQRLMLYDWPGNVRQLENTIEYAVAMTQHDMITEDLVLQTKSEIQEPFTTLKDAKKAFMRSHLIHLLELTKGNVSKAAELAGQYRTNFHAMLKKYNLRSEDFKKEE